jgi:hypothetical protein
MGLVALSDTLNLGGSSAHTLTETNSIKAVNN